MDPNGFYKPPRDDRPRRLVHEDDYWRIWSGWHTFVCWAGFIYLLIQRGAGTAFTFAFWAVLLYWIIKAIEYWYNTKDNY